MDGWHASGEAGNIARTGTPPDGVFLRNQDGSVDGRFFTVFTVLVLYAVLVKSERIRGSVTVQYQDRNVNFDQPFIIMDMCYMSDVHELHRLTRIIS